GSTGFDDGHGVAIDRSGGAYIVGGTSGSLEGPNAGGFDAFVRRYDAGGNVLWRRQFGTSVGDSARAVATDLLGNAYVAGQTDGVLNGANLGSRDGFVRKYDEQGTLIWSQHVGTPLFDVALGVTVDLHGNVFAVGSSTAGDGPLPTGDQSAFVSKLDSDGNVQWLRSFGTIARDTAQSVAADAFGNVYVAGTLGEESAGAGSLRSDAFLAKYDGDGNQLWITR
ncbi:MAG TPA: SBBP repeat-containing protein, partial [Lacipirellulaceae bacterium]|nr:SBBP repeat-containing protein [Lacipirellulaceae bacterium]